VQDLQSKTNFFAGAQSMAVAVKLLRPIVFAVGLLSLTSLSATPPGPKKAPSGPAVTGIELQPAEKFLAPQTCPLVLNFQGHITTTRAVAVTYTWVDSHGRIWPEHHKKFSLAGRNGVHHTWKLGKPGKTVDEWVQLKLISPEAKLTDKVPVRFTCAK
jgi:hypothetical protein